MSELDEEKRIRLTLQVRPRTLEVGDESWSPGHVWTALFFRWRFSAWRSTCGNEPTPSSGISSPSVAQADGGKGGDGGGDSRWHSEELQQGPDVLQGPFRFCGHFFTPVFYFLFGVQICVFVLHVLTRSSCLLVTETIKENNNPRAWLVIFIVVLICVHK